MDYKIKKLPKSEVEITVTVPEEIIEQATKKACDDISKEVKVKGFRPGHVPHHVLEQYVSKEYINAHAQERAIQKSYADVVIKEKLQVVSRPQVNIESETPLTYKAVVAVMPEVEIPSYKDIKVAKKEAKVTEKDINEVIEDLKKHHTTYKDVERGAKKDDRVEVDFAGFDKDGKELEGTKSKNHPVVLGGNSFIPGFEDELIGLKKDEKKEFDITFPKDYHKKDFQNKKVKFKVEVKRVEEAEKPELNEELIEKLTGKKQKVEEFKKYIEENIKHQKEHEAVRERENQYIEELLKKAKVELPEAMVQEEAQYILMDMKNDIVGRGMEFDKFLEQAKTTEEELLKKYVPEAERRIQIRLALHYVIKEEGIKVEEKELKEELNKIKAHYPESESKKIEQEFEQGELRAQLFNKIALKKLFDKVLA